MYSSGRKQSKVWYNSLLINICIFIFIVIHAFDCMVLLCNQSAQQKAVSINGLLWILVQKFL